LNRELHPEQNLACEINPSQADESQLYAIALQIDKADCNLRMISDAITTICAVSTSAPLLAPFMQHKVHATFCQKWRLQTL
jgi:hypothetical protein